MKLSDKEIELFKSLYRSHFGVTLNSCEAEQKGMRLIQCLLLVDKPMPFGEYKKMMSLIRTTINHKTAE